MTKIVLRVSSALSIAVLLIMLLAVGSAPVVLAEADGLPVFSIAADRSSASTGSQIIVSVAMENDTQNDITSFSGDVQFDTRFFRYIGFEDQISMDGSVSVVADLASNGKLSFVYTGSELTNSRINCGDSVVFIKFIFSVVTTYDTTGQFFVGTINDCYYGETNLGVIDCKAQSITVCSTTQSIHTPSTTSPANLSGDARLASLSIQGCTLTPGFNSEFVAYSATVPYETASIRIEATASSSGAIISGLGAKDLAVGLNNFTITVLAENGTIKEYGIIITRLEQTVSTTESTVTTSSTQLTEPTITTTEPIPTSSTTAYTQPSGTVVLDEDENSNATDDVLQIVGIVFGEIALFFFGFLSGFFVDKNLRRKGERADYDDNDYYDEEDDYEDDGPTIYTPSEPIYPEGGYIDPNYQAMPQFTDPQMIQYGQFGGEAPMMPEPIDPSFIAYQQNGQAQQFVPQQPNQFGQGQPSAYPDESFNGNYQDNPYYH